MFYLKLFFFFNFFYSVLCVQLSNATKPNIAYQWRTGKTDFLSYSNESAKWYEIVNGTVQFKFSLVNITDKEVLLYADDRDFFIKILNDKLLFGFSSEQINNELYSGNWIIWNKNSSVVCSIKLNSLTNNSVFNHDLILIKGYLVCPYFKNIYLNNIDSSGRFLTVNNLNLISYLNLIDTKWPLSTNHEFSLLALLNEGANVIKLNYMYLNEKAELNVNVVLNKTNNLTEYLHLAIYLTKDSPQVFDMDPKSKQNESNNLSSAIKRFQTIAKLYQAFNSENLNGYNLGYKSFLYEEDLKKQIVINLIQSNLTLNEFWLKKDNEIYYEISNSIKESSLYSKKSLFRSLHVACLILDSHWDPISKVIKGHTALGGGDGDVKLGIFGSHLTHSWPENLKQLVWRFTDRTPIDTNYVGYDSSPTKFNAFSVGIGAFLHEIGHLLGLDHTGGIMLRGFDVLNRAFLTIEPIGTKNEFIAIKLNLDDQYPIWTKNDSISLSKHVCFNPVIKNYKIKYQWRYSNTNEFVSFDDNTGKWYEMSNNRPFNYFEFVQQDSNGDIIIYDKSRSFYLKISDNKMYFGISIGDINSLLYNGKWIKKP